MSYKLNGSAQFEDPWGESYKFDPDYFPYRNCAGIPEEPKTIVLYSKGPDGVTYSCDDVFRIIK